ncbi:hypothetical protein [Sphingomonas morindae]|uniref:Cyclase dehydrase n=1 Tax=Sphingomonas morindae TaxID=1541170 RepID=A0ABY4X480_9SPHN|nr:hypothetical protein [Sphingomonas morindae]USI71694.1 hypothetical protein LHA26_10180 [Sphingomonas morindae]
MKYVSLSKGLGLFSLALGATELIAARRIATALEAPERSGLVKAFGLREIVAGIGLLGAPAHAPRVWNRVAGDGLDLAALGGALRRAPRNRFAWGALAFVLGATALDLVTARGLDRTTGKTLPV